MILLSLTITVGALLLVIGCGGAKGTLPTVSSDQSLVAGPTRGDSAPNVPFVVAPRNGTIYDGKQVIFLLWSSDPDGDRLQYRIVLQGQNTGYKIVFDQTQSTQGWSKPDYASGELARFYAPKLPADVYIWTAQAFDGSNWGPLKNPSLTFTVR